MRENDKVRILWNFNIHTDRVTEARRPDIVVVDKLNSETTIVDIAVPGDFRVKEKESEKIKKYQDQHWRKPACGRRLPK